MAVPSSTVENYLKSIYLAETMLAGDRQLVPMGQLASALGVTPGTATTPADYTRSTSTVSAAIRVRVSRGSTHARDTSHARSCFRIPFSLGPSARVQAQRHRDALNKGSSQLTSTHRWADGNVDRALTRIGPGPSILPAELLRSRYS